MILRVSGRHAGILRVSGVLFGAEGRPTADEECSAAFASVLQSASSARIIFGKSRRATRFAPCSETVARSGTQQRAVLQDKQRCKPKLARAASITDFLAKPVAQQSR